MMTQGVAECVSDDDPGCSRVCVCQVMTHVYRVCVSGDDPGWNVAEFVCQVMTHV